MVGEQPFLGWWSPGTGAWCLSIDWHSRSPTSQGTIGTGSEQGKFLSLGSLAKSTVAPETNTLKQIRTLFKTGVF